MLIRSADLRLPTDLSRELERISLEVTRRNAEAVDTWLREVLEWLIRGGRVARDASPDELVGWCRTHGYYLEYKIVWDEATPATLYTLKMGDAVVVSELRVVIGPVKT